MTYDQWKLRSPDDEYPYDDEEEEPTDDEYAFMDWCDEMIAGADSIAPYGTWLLAGPFVIEVEPIDCYYGTVVLPSCSDVAIAQWLKF